MLTNTSSADPCGCDQGAYHLCARHELDPIKHTLHALLKRFPLEKVESWEYERVKADFEFLYEWSIS